jgi:hypothetical protein
MNTGWLPDKTKYNYQVERLGRLVSSPTYEKFLKSQLGKEGYKFYYPAWIKRRTFLLYRNLIRMDKERWAFYNAESKNFICYVVPHKK